MPVAMWHSLDGLGLDRCVVDTTAEGHRLVGTALLVADGEPYEIRYSVITDGDWRTQTVGAHVQGPSGDRRLALNADGAGGWNVADNPILDLYGAVDVDLAWTPATNTLPIRRLGLAVGESAEITVAYIDFPGHSVTRRTQSYRRLAEHEYRFTSGTFSADITIDGDGLVAGYEGLWEKVAAPETGTLPPAQLRPRASSNGPTSQSPENS